MHWILWILPSLVGSTSVQKIIFSLKKLPNGTYIPVITRETVEVEEDNEGFDSSLIAAVFIVLFFILGFLGNVLLISTIGSSITLKRLPFNVIIMNLGIVCCIECVLNFGISFAYLVTEPWHFGKIVCHLNSAVMELIPAVYTIILVILITDRTIALRNPSLYKRNLSVKKHQFFILFWWILLILSMIPLGIGIIESWPFPSRYSCHIMDAYSMVYGLSTGVGYYTISWGISLGLAVLIARYINAFFMANAHLWNEIKNIFVVGALYTLYILFLCPYIFMTKVDQIMMGYGSGYDIDFYKEQTLPQHKTFNDTNDDGTNISSRIVIKRDPLDIPEIKEPHINSADTAFIWMRYMHALLFPILVFSTHRGLRKKALILFRCCHCWRPNSIENRDSPRPVSAYIRQKRKELIKQRKKFKNATNYSVPVLFVTSDGLFLRILDENYSGFSEHKSVLEHSLESKSQWTVDPEFVTELCDLIPDYPQTLGPTPIAEDSSAPTSPASLNEGFEDDFPLIQIKEEDFLKKRQVEFLTKIEEISAQALYPTKEINEDLLNENSPKKKKKNKKKSKKPKKNIIELNPIYPDGKRWNY